MQGSKIRLAIIVLAYPKNKIIECSGVKLISQFTVSKVDDNNSRSQNVRCFRSAEEVGERARICPRYLVSAGCWHVQEFLILRQKFIFESANAPMSTAVS